MTIVESIPTVCVWKPAANGTQILYSPESPESGRRHKLGAIRHRAGLWSAEYKGREFPVLYDSAFSAKLAVARARAREKGALIHDDESRCTRTPRLYGA